MALQITAAAGAVMTSATASGRLLPKGLSSSSKKAAVPAACLSSASSNAMLASSASRQLKCSVQRSAAAAGEGHADVAKWAAMMEFRRGSMSEDFDENDESYVTASVLEATEVKSGRDGFVIKMSDGKVLNCEHNQPQGNRLPEYPSQPAMVLKLNDGSEILLPIIVLELPSTMLIEAMRDVPLLRPTVYQVLQNMIDVMGYELKLVRITHRECEAYYARIYLSKFENQSETLISLDLRPSDAINIAVRAKAPIQVNRELAAGDGVTVVTTSHPKLTRTLRVRSKFVMTEADRAGSDACDEAQEFEIVRMMQQAASEERYDDAAKMRDQLIELRFQARIRALNHLEQEQL